MEDPLLFALATLAILAAPGPTNVLLATGGATSGWRQALLLVPAAAAGYGIAILTLGLVLGPVLAGWPLLILVLRAGAGGYLLLLAVRMWRRGATPLRAGTVVTPAQLFVATLLNPKVIVLALGIVPFDAPVPLPYLLGFLVLLAPVAGGWVLAGAMLGRAAHRGGWSNLLPRAGAATLGAFAVLLLAAALMP